ncbi:MAG: UDP-N-acetylmuramoyl-L-alanyl-D-glutamate--2,6-diaminopimelate ligase, partial [Planctomycetota bacterium]
VHDAVRRGSVAILTDASGAPAVSSGAAVLIAEDVPLTAALLAERFFGSPSRHLRLAGVTGTNGKSSVVHLAHGLLNAAGVRCGMVGTVEIDDGREVARSPMTTVPAIELSRTLATMVEHGCEAAVIEVSSHALDQRRVDALSFDAAVFTMLGSDHLDYHGTQDVYAASKARLFALLGSDALAVVNADDPSSERMLNGCAAAVVRCSADSSDESRADARCRIQSENLEGLSAELEGPFGLVQVRLPGFGAHNAMNALQAACLAHRFGVTGDRLREAFASPTLPPGRLERVGAGSGLAEDSIAVFVDFAHTVDALEHALSAVRGIAGGRRVVCVFGCGGDRDRRKRPQMGRVAASLADLVVLTSDNPRTEPPQAIIAEVLTGIAPTDRDRVVVHTDRGRAIEHAVGSAAAGDVVVIAGKGHETEQIAADPSGALVSREFDDRRVAIEAMRRRAVRVGEAVG